MAEHKYLNTRVFGNTSPAAGNFGCLSLVPIGTDTVNRIGTRTLGTSIEIGYFFRPAVPTGTVTDYQWVTNLGIRFVIFIWKDDTTPDISTLFDNIAIPTSTLNPLRPFNHEYKVKRKILYNRYIGFSSGWNVAATEFTALCKTPVIGQVTIPLTKLKNKLNEINFQPGIAVTGGTNHIWFAIITNDFNPAANASSSFFTLHTRYNFVDF